MNYNYEEYLLSEDKEVKLSQKELDYGKKYKISEDTLKNMKEYYEQIVTEKEENENITYDHWIKRFEENPYLLINVVGFGFMRCDNLAKKIGYDMESPNRIIAYVTKAIEDTSKGSTILKFTDVIETINKNLGIKDNKKIISIIFSNKGKFTLLDVKCKYLSLEEINKNKKIPEYITVTDWYFAEKFCYEWLKNTKYLKKTKTDINITEKILNNSSLNSKQKEIVEHILDKNINIIIGKAGTGKSYTTKQILDILDAYGISYCLLTPTGISSVNLSEKVGRVSSTIHRRYFSRYKSEIREIKEEYVIIDEIGMVGAEHFRMLSKLIPNKDKKIIFIGDANQLPSISAGDFLSNILSLIKQKKVIGNIFELTEIMRASSETFIPYFCNMFCDDSKFNPEILNKKMKNVTFVNRDEDLLEQVKNIMEVNKWTFYNTAIIIPQNVGDFGCNNFNKYFQSLNESEILFSNKYKIFKKGDKLMHIKNNTELDIYNGEWVEMIGIEYGETFFENKYYLKKLNDKTLLEYNYDTVNSQLMLGYAVTVHKCQGSTIENVIFLTLKEQSFMLTRELTYTGISRTAKNIVIVGDKEALTKSSYRKLSNTRITFLGLISNM